MTKFKAALDSGKFKDKVDADAKEGAAVGATGTPTFFINGTKARRRSARSTPSRPSSTPS